MEACIPCLGVRKRRVPPPPVEGDPHHSNVVAAARTFSVQELAAAQMSFKDEHHVVGREAYLYRGRLKSVNQVVAMKLQHLVDHIRNNVSTEQLNIEFLARVLMLNALRHPNLLNLIGYCANGDYWILVHEYIPLGSLEVHLHVEVVASVHGAEHSGGVDEPPDVRLGQVVSVARDGVPDEVTTQTPVACAK